MKEWRIEHELEKGVRVKEKIVRGAIDERLGG